MIYKYFRKVLCYLGWHTFSFELQEDMGIVLDYIPDSATCDFCGTHYID